MIHQLNSLILLLISYPLIVWACDYCGQKTCYELLSVDSSASEAQIRKQYRLAAKKYHPDRNQQEDTKELFQLINRAHQILTDEKSRYKYDLYLQNPSESEMYRQYRYYSNKYVQNPQIHPLIVIVGVIVIFSILHYIIRKQMYQAAIESIVEGDQFKQKVNQRCAGNKKIKQTIKQKLKLQISIEGGYSKPQLTDILIYQIMKAPVNIIRWIWSCIRWNYLYRIRRQPYRRQDKNELTRKALGIAVTLWNKKQQSQKQKMISKQLWIKKNLQIYQEQQKMKWLEELKKNNPNRYAQVIKYLRKNK